MKKIILLLFLLALYTAEGQSDQCPCCTDDYTSFDFWVGSWEVTNPKGIIVGYSEIEKIQDNCIILENWKAANQNYTGTSFNTFNQKTNQWEQLWIDNAGQILKLKGSRIENKMVLESEPSTDNDGNSIVQRITWTDNEDGTVRQKWESITNQTDIKVAFNGLYSKRDQ